MKINAISNAINSFSKKSVSRKNQVSDNNPVQNTVSFKGVYLEDTVNLGDASNKTIPATFFKRDALLINKIASEYPNQDCFIRRGYASFPKLEYRERPPVVQNFSASPFREYKISVEPNDEEYPCVPLILDGESTLSRFIGLPSYFSLNPSLSYTIKVGFELHKKLLEKKYQIMEAVGKNDSVILGEKTLVEKAHEAIQELEEAVKRYLLESAFLVLEKKPSARQIYESDYLKVHSTMDAERMYDLTTSRAKQAEIHSMLENEDVDICDFVAKKYPDYQENVRMNEQLESYMSANRITIN